MLAGQTHNVLRNPERAVFAAFPEADGYRAIVREVDDAARRRIEARLPFPVHFNELGRHALYLALRGRRPIGFVQVRTEQTEWGLTEIVWSLSVQLRVSGFHLQRCRSQHGAALQRSPFARVLAGCGIAGLGELLQTDGRLATGATGLPAGSEELATTIVHSAMKAIAVIEAAWADQLGKLQDFEMGLCAFPNGTSFQRLVGQTTPAAPLGEPTASRIVESTIVRARDPGGAVLGVVADTLVRYHDRQVRLRWTLDTDRRVRSVDTTLDGPDGAARAAFKQLEETGVPAEPEVELIARELRQLIERSER